MISLTTKLLAAIVWTGFWTGFWFCLTLAFLKFVYPAQAADIPVPRYDSSSKYDTGIASYDAKRKLDARCLAGGCSKPATPKYDYCMKLTQSHGFCNRFYRGR